MSTRPSAIRISDLSHPQLADAIVEYMKVSAAAQPSWTVSEVLNTARQQTGLDSFGAEDFIPRLECILQGLMEDRNLSDFGRLTCFTILVRYASNRQRLEDFIRRHPDALDEEIQRPIIVAGLPRAGTTHLLNLISADAGLRHLPYWEALAPIPLAGESVAGQSLDTRWQDCDEALQMQDQIMPLFKNMHEMTADHTHEEIELAGMDFSCMLFENYGLVPRWRDYYLSHDQRPHYSYMKKVLKVLQYLRGPKRWVLKSPQHMEQLPVLYETFPDATFVLPHRDPAAILVSLSTMLSYSSRMSRSPVLPTEITAYWQDRLRRMLTACVRDHANLPAEQTVDITFDDFMADDIAAVERIYRVAGREFTDRIRQQMKEYMREHPRGRFGAIKYNTEELGVDIKTVRKEYGFYMERFRLREEY